MRHMSYKPSRVLQQSQPFAETSPLGALIREDALPFVWCSGCGLGIVLSAYLDGVLKSERGRDSNACVCGIGCVGRIAKYIDIDSYEVPGGRAIPFAIGLAISRPDLEVFAIVGEGELNGKGRQHLRRAAARNVDLNIIVVSNFGANNPIGTRGKSDAGGETAMCTDKFEDIPLLVASEGASFSARWTTMHTLQIRTAVRRMMQTDGFALLEVLSPCPIASGESAKGLMLMKYFQDKSALACDSPSGESAKRSGESLIVGNIVQRTRASYQKAISEPHEQENFASR
jgi:2-oxoglutarate/2-oxoacid ferredoxin oxidoreductase subunit beta